MKTSYSKKQAELSKHVFCHLKKNRIFANEITTKRQYIETEKEKINNIL